MNTADIQTLAERVEKLASRGLTKKQIADCIGISRDTLWRKEKRYSDISDAIKRGRAKGLATITNNLYEQSQKGNTAATIFYLKNRDPGRWSDRQNVDITSGSKPFVISAQPMQAIEEWAAETPGVTIEGEKESPGEPG